MVRHLTVCSSLLFSTVILFAPTAFAEDLGALVKEYREAAATVGGAPKARAREAKEKIAPVVDKIARLGSDEALAFLLKELDGAIPEIGAQFFLSAVNSDQ